MLPKGNGHMPWACMKARKRSSSMKLGRAFISHVEECIGIWKSQIWVFGDSEESEVLDVYRSLAPKLSFHTLA